MSDDISGTDTHDQAVEAFWNLARFHARLNTAPSYFGPTTLEVVPPPTWSFGPDADGLRLLDEVLDGSRTSLDAPAADYADEPLPVPGSLSILLDAQDRPVALLEVTSVDAGAETVTEHFRVVHRAE